MKTQLILGIAFSVLASSVFAAPSVQAVATNAPGVIHHHVLIANASVVHHRVLIAESGSDRLLQNRV